MLAETPEYWVTRFLFQRSIGAIYCVAFLVVLNQFLALCGEHGLLPAKAVLERSTFWESPSIFWFNSSDQFISIIAVVGFVLAVLAVSGLSDAHGMFVSMTVWLLLWAIYLSFVNIGSTFYGFGWETLLLEVGFLTAFLGSQESRPPVIVIWLLRWVLFRLIFGAGLIKIRGDPCWRDLTCMVYHYETQPMPNPLSWYFHRMPLLFHKGAVLYNHFVELVVPFFYFFPAPFRYAAAIFTILFQVILIASGNFSWLNYLSICLCITCFDDSFFAYFSLTHAPTAVLYPWHRYAVFALTACVAALSIKPTLNLLSAGQIMNTSFEPLHLVNTYGAFGSITRVRNEIILEGTDNERPSESAEWKEYEFKGKPGNVYRRPPLVAPYHYRLDWQIWFAAMAPPCAYSRWLLRFQQKLLEGDAAVIKLLANNPFPDSPPHFLRAVWYEYHFTTAAERRETGAWWKRTRIAACPALMMSRALGERIDLHGE